MLGAHAPTVQPAASTVQTVLGLSTLGVGALSVHVGHQWRKHGLSEAWRKSMRRKGTAFHLSHQDGWLADVSSGLLHFKSVWQLKRLAAGGASSSSSAEVVADLHGEFWERTREVNEAEKKQKQSQATDEKEWKNLTTPTPQPTDTVTNTSATQTTTSISINNRPPTSRESLVWPEFSRSEVAAHSSRDDCWIVIRRKVYDVGGLDGWMQHHPGGARVLHRRGGQDCSTAFTEAEHSLTAHRVLQRYQVGVVQEAEAAGEVIEYEGSDFGRRARASVTS